MAWDDGTDSGLTEGEGQKGVKLHQEQQVAYRNKRLLFWLLV